MASYLESDMKKTIIDYNEEFLRESSCPLCRIIANEGLCCFDLISTHSAGKSCGGAHTLDSVNSILIRSLNLAKTIAAIPWLSGEIDYYSSKLNNSDGWHESRTTETVCNVESHRVNSPKPPETSVYDKNKKWELFRMNYNEPIVRNIESNVDVSIFTKKSSDGLVTKFYQTKKFSDANVILKFWNKSLLHRLFNDDVFVTQHNSIPSARNTISTRNDNFTVYTIISDNQDDISKICYIIFNKQIFFITTPVVVKTFSPPPSALMDKPPVTSANMDKDSATSLPGSPLILDNKNILPPPPPKKSYRNMRVKEFVLDKLTDLLEPYLRNLNKTENECELEPALEIPTTKCSLKKSAVYSEPDLKLPTVPAYPWEADIQSILFDDDTVLAGDGKVDCDFCKPAGKKSWEVVPNSKLDAAYYHLPVDILHEDVDTGADSFKAYSLWDSNLDVKDILDGFSRQQTVEKAQEYEKLYDLWGSTFNISDHEIFKRSKPESPAPQQPIQSFYNMWETPTLADILTNLCPRSQPSSYGDSVPNKWRSEHIFNDDFPFSVTAGEDIADSNSSSASYYLDKMSAFQKLVATKNPTESCQNSTNRTSDIYNCRGVFSIPYQTSFRGATSSSSLYFGQASSADPFEDFAAACTNESSKDSWSVYGDTSGVWKYNVKNGGSLSNAAAKSGAIPDPYAIARSKRDLRNPCGIYCGCMHGNYVEEDDDEVAEITYGNMSIPVERYLFKPIEPAKMVPVDKMPDFTRTASGQLYYQGSRYKEFKREREVLLANDVKFRPKYKVSTNDKACQTDIPACTTETRFDQWPPYQPPRMTNFLMDDDESCFSGWYDPTVLVEDDDVDDYDLGVYTLEESCVDVSVQTSNFCLGI